jgi:flagellar L-ring protein precursor FlgH
VNVAEELVLMIQTQRAYELNSKAVTTSDAMLGKLTSLYPAGENHHENRSTHSCPSAAVLALAGLAGCAALQATPPTAVHQPMTVRPEPRSAQASQPGSIFQSSFRGLVRRSACPLRRRRDHREPRRATAAAKKSSANAERNSSLSASISALNKLPLKGLAGLDATASDASKFGGKGDAAANNTFTGTITTTVIEVLSNGNLLVSGEKQVAINQGNEFIRFSGIVNPVYVTGSNTVQSTQVADARVEYRANGFIDETETMGWMQRLRQRAAVLRSFAMSRRALPPPRKLSADVLAAAAACV